MELHHEVYQAPNCLVPGGSTEVVSPVQLLDTNLDLSETSASDFQSDGEKSFMEIKSSDPISSSTLKTNKNSSSSFTSLSTQENSTSSLKSISINSSYLSSSQRAKKTLRRRRRKQKNVQPLPASEIDRKFSNYRKIRDNPTLCGPYCECYYCSLLNNPPTDEDSDENSDDVLDTVAVAYGYQKSYQSLRKRHQGQSSSRKHQRTKRQLDNKQQCHKSHMTLCSFCSGGDHATYSEDRREKGQPILQGVPKFVKDFEKVLRETRQKSMGDSIFDSILNCFDWLGSEIQNFFIFLFEKDSKKVSPELPMYIDELTSRNQILPDQFLLDDPAEDQLHSVAVIRNM